MFSFMLLLCNNLNLLVIVNVSNIVFIVVFIKFNKYKLIEVVGNKFKLVKFLIMFGSIMVI